MSLQIASLNANGLRDVHKVRRIFSYMTEKYVDILCLQETFWNEEFCNTISHLWNGKIYISSCDNSNRRGVAILINRSIANSTSIINSDTEGRIIQINVNIESENINIVNIYAPNNVTERKIFFNAMETYMSTSVHNLLIGDFNCVLDSSIDLAKGMYSIDYSRSRLLEFISKYELRDIWRHKYPDRVQFSRQQIVNGTLKQSRIDYILISKSLIVKTINCYIQNTMISDHNMIFLKLNMSTVERGQGMWIMNNSFLQIEKYVTKIIDIFNREKQSILHNTEPLIYWDNVKYKIKKYSQLFGREQKEIKNRVFWQTQNRLNAEYRKLANDNNYDKTTLIELQDTLAQVEKETCDGAVLRSKSINTIEGEKNTKYFLNLEQIRQNKKNIRELYNSDNIIVSDTDSFLQEEYAYFSKLYSQPCIITSAQDTLLSFVKPCLNPVDIANCDKDITLPEIKKALDGMAKNKSPGSDGLTVEFYLAFWDIIGPELLNLYREIEKEKKLSRSMKSGLITLIFKKGDARYLENWRPISLLNVDYKILARVFANRLKSVIDKIVSPYQTCCVPGRDISDTVLSVHTIIEYIEDEQLEGFVLKIDQRKAFDKISHSYLFTVLKKFGLGDSFISWIKIFYTDICSSVKCNGFMTPYFKLEQSVRQGCPISAMLYIICVEPLGIMLRNSSNIRGIKLPGIDMQSLLFQHADDTTLTVIDKRSIDEAFKICKLYGDATGAEVNMGKSEVLPLGESAKTKCKFKTNVTIVTECINVLGIYMGPNKCLCESLNWRAKVNAIKSIINLWKQRTLTLKGKAIVISSLLLSRLYYMLNTVTMPDWAHNDIKCSIIKFLWNGKTSLIAYQTIIGKFNSGGLNIPDLQLKMSSFRLKFMRRLLDSDNENVWKYIVKHYLTKYGGFNMGEELFRTIIVKKDYMKLPNFCQEMLQAWQDLSNIRKQCVENYIDVLEQPICRNPAIKFNGKMLDLPILMISGILKIKDILYEYVPGFLPLNAIKEMVAIEFPEADLSHFATLYNVIKVSIPHEWNDLLKVGKLPDDSKTPLYVCINEVNMPISNCTTAVFYKLLLDNYFRKPTGESFWIHKYPKMEFDKIWKIVNLSIKSYELVALDYKVSCNIIFTMAKLNQMKIVSSPLCHVCETANEDIMHLFIDCPELIDLKLLIANMSETIFSNAPATILNSISLDECLLFGYCKTHRNVNTIFFNLVLSVYRYSVYMRRHLSMTHESPIYYVVQLFHHNLRNHINIMYQWYKRNGKLSNFQKYVLTNNKIVYLKENTLEYYIH